MRKFSPVRIGLCLATLCAALPCRAQSRWQHFLYGGESYCVAAHGTEVWVGTTAGIRIYDTSGPAVRHRELSVRDRLPGNLVTAVAFEPKAVWVGTQVGVVGRLDLDRREWVYFDEQARFPRAEVTALVADGQDVWAATRGGGLARYNPLRQDWEVWDHEEGLPSDQVNCLVADRSGLWAGTDHGLVRYLAATRRWEPVTAPAGRLEGRISGLAVSGQYLWVAGVGDGLTRIDTTSGDFLTYDLSRFGSARVDCVTAGPSGQVWVGVDNGLLSAPENGQGNWELLARGAWAPRGLVAVGGAVWVGTVTQGVWRYQLESGAWEQYRAADPLPSGNLTAVASQANLGWFGFRDDGLARYDTLTGQWSQLLPPSGEPRRVRDVAAHGNQVYCACADGIAIYDQRGQVWRTYLAKYETDLLADDWTSVRVVGDTVWFAGPGRVSLFSTGEPEFLQTIELRDGGGRADDLPQLLTDDSSGDVWCLTSGLAYRYQPRHQVWSWLDSEQLIPRDPNRYRSAGRLLEAAVCDNDSVWFVLVDRLAQYRKQLNDVVLWDATWHAGLAEPQAVAVDRFSAWVACGPGLAQYERQAQQWNFAPWPAELQGEVPTVLAVDAFEPYIWVATARRVARAGLAEGELSWTVFPPSTGIVSGVKKILPARDGVWFVGRGGVTWHRRDLPAGNWP